MSELINHRDLFFCKENIGDDARSILRSFLSSKTQRFPAEIFTPTVNQIENKARAIVLELNKDEHEQFFSYQDLHTLNPLIAEVFGKLVPQNDIASTVISVYDRNRSGSMFKGSRYHQTREGGSIHTDNVNIPEVWDTLLLSCLAPAMVGGENILVDGIKVHQKLKADFPAVLKILEAPFYWEMRGVADKLYQAPIITYDKNQQPLFRHLRPYMESAHEKANVPLTTEQLVAIDVLDALTNSSEFQIRYKLKTGDILITRDAQVLHGRTCYSDSIEAVCFDEFEQGKGLTLKRTMERLWIRK